MNDLTVESSRDWLSRWRLRAGLRASQVDQCLGHIPGTTTRYEHLGLLRVPCCEISRMVELYHVTDDEFLKVVCAETSKLRKKQ